MCCCWLCTCCWLKINTCNSCSSLLAERHTNGTGSSQNSPCKLYIIDKPELFGNTITISLNVQLSQGRVSLRSHHADVHVLVLVVSTVQVHGM